MSRTVIVLMLSVISLIFAAECVFAAECAAGPKGKPAKFSVVKIKGFDGTISFEIVSADLLGELKKSHDKEYKEAVKKWTSDKAEAKKNKEEFATPKPTAPLVQVVASNLEMSKAEEIKKKAEEDLLKQQNGASNGGSSNKAEKYSVLKITGMDGSVSFEMELDKQVNALKKRLETEYKAALKDWDQKKKEASNNKDEFTDPRPSKPAVKIIKKGLVKLKADTCRQNSEDAYNAQQEKKNSRKKK